MVTYHLSKNLSPRTFLVTTWCEFNCDRLGSTRIRSESMKPNFMCLRMPSSCPCCHSQWPDDRWKWAQPGLYISTFHHMENRSVTFCASSCENPLHCPRSSLASEYDAGLFPDIGAMPSCKVTEERMGLTWFWKVRQADRWTRFRHSSSLLRVIRQLCVDWDA